MVAGMSIAGCAANIEVATPTPTAAISGTITINRPTPLPALTPPPTVVRRLDANTSSMGEMRAAFATAGILRAADWAAAIEAGRPYPADDISWAKLRGVLDKAGAPPTSVEQIIVLLSR